MSTLRPIAPIEINEFEPGGTPSAMPIFELAKPETLLIDEGYQRDSSDAPTGPGCSSRTTGTGWPSRGRSCTSRPLPPVTATPLCSGHPHNDVHWFFFECPWCGIDCEDTRHERADGCPLQFGTAMGATVNPQDKEERQS